MLCFSFYMDSQYILFSVYQIFKSSPWFQWTVVLSVHVWNNLGTMVSNVEHQLFPPAMIEVIGV